METIHHVLCIYLFTLARNMTKKLSSLISLKMAERSEAKKREAKLRVKLSYISSIDAKLRFALFTSLRSAIFNLPLF